MKNIHVLPTEKPSRLFNCFGKLEIGDYTTIRENLQVTNQHIYITNDEEITGFENNIWVIKADRIFLWQNTMALVSNNKPRKIILTTDQDLIKDGIQAIDDEFLEWFVENPSCEEVDVENAGPGFPAGIYFINYLPEHFTQEITIPKEEPKQETLDEAAERLYPTTIDSFTDGGFDLSERERLIFINGAEWQQERMYSEEIELINWLQSLTAKKFYSSDAEDLLEQFKKK